MAVELTATAATFVGTGAVANYAAPIYANANDQIQVFVDGVPQTLGDDYVLNGLGAAAGISVVGNFTLGAAIYVQRVTPIKQKVDTKNNETILEDVLDDTFDRLTMMIQERAGELARAALVPRGEDAPQFTSLTGSDGELLILSGGQIGPVGKAAFAGKYYGGDGTGRPVPLSGTGADAALRADLASAVGDLLVRVTAAHPSAVASTIGVKIKQMIELRDTGAIGLNNAGDAAALDLLFSGAQPGQTLHGLRTNALAAQFKKTGGTFNITRMVDFDFEHGVDIRSDQATGSRFSAVTYRPNRSDGEVANTFAGEARGGWLRGGRILTYNTTTAALDNLAGAYGLDIGDDNGANQSKSIILLTVEKMRLGGGFGAVRLTSGNGHETQWSQIVRCSLTNGTTIEGEDGIIAVDCVSDGVNTGFIFKKTFGAFCSGVFRGTVVNSDGAIDIVDGSMVKLHDVQIEHPSSDPAGTGMSDGGHIRALGQTYTGQGNELIGANIGAGAYVTNSVSLYNQRHFKIYRCQWNIAGPAGVSADLLLHRDADPTKDTYDTILGYDQIFRGPRALQVVGSLTDVTRRMVIGISGGALRQPQRGMWFPLFSLITGAAGGLTDSGLECLIDHSGDIRFNGRLTRAGFFGDTLVVGTLPTWLLPFAEQRFLVHGDSGQVATGIIKTDGTLVISGAGLAASTSLWIPNGAWNVVVNRGYITVL